MNSSELVEAYFKAAITGGTLVEQLPDTPAGQPFAEEWKTFKREVYRLMCHGHKGRFVLIQGEQVLSVWDTLDDAIQAGRERFGQQPFFVQEVQLYVKPIRSGYGRLCPNN
jgi:hypothetical protein